MINNASNGVLYDWDADSRHELIDYYQRTLKSAPENKRLYFYLLDNLIADGRLREAKLTLDESFQKNPDSLNTFIQFLLKQKKRDLLKSNRSILP